MLLVVVGIVVVLQIAQVSGSRSIAVRGSRAADHVPQIGAAAVAKIANELSQEIGDPQSVYQFVELDRRIGGRQADVVLGEKHRNIGFDGRSR
jgi:hypothetical protein